MLGSINGMRDRAMIIDAHKTEPIAAPDAQVTADSRLERLKLYTSHLETIILSRHTETNDQNGILEARVEETRQKQLEHECIMTHQAVRSVLTRYSVWKSSYLCSLA